MKATVIIAALVAALAPAAHAMTGQEFLNKSASNDPGEFHAAMFYARGVADGGQTYWHCAPTKVTAGQIAMLTRNMLTNNPRLWHEPVGYVIAQVLLDEWPCEKKPARSGKGPV